MSNANQKHHYTVRYYFVDTAGYSLYVFSTESEMSDEEVKEYVKKNVGARCGEIDHIGHVLA